MRVAINGVWVDAYLDTGATISLVSSRFVRFDDLVPINICGVKTGEGGVTLTEGEIEGEVQVGDRKVLQKFQAFDTDAFEAVLGTDFFAQNEWIKYLSLHECTHLLVVNEEQEWEAIPVKETKCPRPTLKTLKSFLLALDSEVKQESILATLSLHRTENYTLFSAGKRDAFGELGLNPNTCKGDFVQLFVSQENAGAEYFCTPKTNNTWRYDWGTLGASKMLYANPPFSKILHTLVKVFMDQATVALVIPQGKKWEETEKLWGPLLEMLKVTELLLPDVPLYRRNPKEEVFPKPRWRTAMYLVSGKNLSSNPMENVSEKIKKFVLKHHRGYGKEKMMKSFPDVDESKKEHKFETPKFEVEEVVQESPKDARETREESEKTFDESRSISEAPFESTIPFLNDSYTTMDYDDLVANLFLEEVEPLDALSTHSETPNPEKLLSHVSVPLESMTSEGDERELRLLHARPRKNSFPSSKEDLEETRLLLLNQIDRLQKPELREKWKSMVYLEDYDREDGTYFDVGEELFMLHERHEALEQEEQEIGGEEEKKEERKDQLRRKDIKRLGKKAKEKRKIDHQANQMILDPEQVLALKKVTEQDEKSKKKKLGASNLHATEDLKILLDKMDVDERIKKIILPFSDLFGPLPPPGSVKKLVTMDLELR